MFKATIGMVRRDDMSPEEYREYYENSHAPRVDELVGVRKYTLTFTTDDDSPYDSVAELYSENEAAYGRAMSSDLMAELLEDLNNFTNRDEMLLLAGEESVLTGTGTATAPS
jgi:uncharacterized protein (TIGR02118 family)